MSWELYRNSTTTSLYNKQSRKYCSFDFLPSSNALKRENEISGNNETSLPPSLSLVQFMLFMLKQVETIPLTCCKSRQIVARDIIRRYETEINLLAVSNSDSKEDSSGRCNNILKCQSPALNVRPSWTRNLIQYRFTFLLPSELKKLRIVLGQTGNLSSVVYEPESLNHSQRRNWHLKRAWNGVKV